MISGENLKHTSLSQAMKKIQAKSHDSVGEDVWP